MRRLGLAACIVAAAAGALAVRLPRLADRPMHPDEANQAKKAALLAGLVPEEPGYRYDPDEHHGPSLYWLTLPALWLSGATDFAETSEADYRIVPVLFGAGLVLLLPLMADGLGRGATVVAGIFTAVSPAMVFHARYYIQETLLVFFTFAALACAWRWWRTGAMGWAIGAGASFGLMHATKETWVLAAAAMAGGLILTALWSRWRDGEWPAPASDGQSAPDARRPRLLPAAFAAAAAFGVVAVAFYSSFGADWRGLSHSVQAWTTYARRGTEAGIHDNPPLFYLERLLAFRPAKGFFWSEGLIAGLAAVGAVYALAFRERAGARAAAPVPTLVRFLAFYTLLLTAIYSAIPYKTPWCALSSLHGMVLLAGVGAWALVVAVPAQLPGRSGWPLRLLMFLALAAGTWHLGRQCDALNFRPSLFADVRNPWIYAHTATDVLRLAERMEQLAAVSPEGHGLAIHVITPDNYWPLPWYLRRFDRSCVGYWQGTGDWLRETRELPPPSVVILTSDVQEAVDAHLRGAYNQQMLFRLRPEVFVSVYVREDLWEAFLASVSDQPPPAGP